MIWRKREQKNETIIELKKENKMFPSCTAFSYFISFLARATIRKSRLSRKKIIKE